MDGHPTLVFKPVYKSFKFKTFEDMEGLKVEKNTSLKDNNVFMANPKSKHPEVVQSPHPDEKWKAAIDHDLPELVAFLQDSGHEFVKDICIDSEVLSQNKCLEENCDLNLNSVSCMVISSDAESSSESTAESQDSLVSLNSSVSKHISEHVCKDDVSKRSGFEDLTIEDGEHFGETDDTSSDHSTKKTISETLLQIRQDPTKAVLSDSVVVSSTEAIDDNRRSKNSLKSALENARRGETFPPSVECHSRNSSEDGMSDNVTESSQSQHHLCRESSSSVSGHLAIYSGAIPSFGSISFRSNSSTTSSRSFTFPILSSEWVGSPVRMVEADRTQLRRHRRWGVRFLCCSF
ncbi:uncharacterized protein LOC133706746 [Rosa rugosa]|uniref:uncharacterized protein LOC133706746 n=1 Tax=Rosa rugosa TaxID=74645 RepID=UPI002B4020B7|nr:uncharacterized protein LOC133706746 [Rosa rugosa]XP_061988270.1 uncharacterized protein LOC133706746 [Rosa rugosa]XP_061988271.1 uncharacterized protein LOC133706746 [Rosa rugosa]